MSTKISKSAPKGFSSSAENETGTEGTGTSPGDGADPGDETGTGTRKSRARAISDAVNARNENERKSGGAAGTGTMMTTGDGTATETRTHGKRGYRRAKLPYVNLSFGCLTVGAGLDEEGRLRLAVKVKKAIRGVLAAHHPEIPEWRIDMAILPVADDRTSPPVDYGHGAIHSPLSVGRVASTLASHPPAGVLVGSTHRDAARKPNGSDEDMSPDESGT
jgi:hypothetical protein